MTGGQFSSQLFLATTCLLAATAFAAPTRRGSCTAVPLAKCGTDFANSCLSCGTKSAFDCEKCCPGCEAITKNGYSYCQCGKKPTPGPTPIPAPTPGGDTWEQYEVSGMDVRAVTGGPTGTHEKVVVMLHGGGEDNTMWQYYYTSGWFGNMTGLKYVFPTTARTGHTWYQSFKNGCGLNDDCAYNMSTIQDSATRIATLIEHERGLLSSHDGSKIYLAGFSQGAQMTPYVQLVKLDFALGGAIVMDGYPLPPLVDMPGSSQSVARANASYYGQDMRFMIYHGQADPIFPCNATINVYHEIFDALGVRDTLKVEHTEPGMTHTVTQPEIEMIVQFIRGELA